MTIKFANSPPCACSGSSGQKPHYGLITLIYQRFTDVLLLIYGSLFLSGVYYCLSVFCCVAARMYEQKLDLFLKKTMDFIAKSKKEELEQHELICTL
jgi:hypothetical protein